MVADDRIYSGIALTFTTADQTEGKYYTYRVRAVNVSQSAFTSELAYHTMPMPATTQQNNQLALTWSKLYPNLYYQMWYAQESGSPGNIGSWQGGWNVYDNTSYSTGLSPLYRYKTKLRPYSLPNGGVYWDVTDGQWYSPLWPQINYLRFVNPGQTSVTLKWPNQNINNSATIRIKRDGFVVYQGIPAGYNYEYDSTAGGYYYVASWTDTNLQPGLQYSYEICAVNALGDCGTPRTQTFLTLPPTPDSKVMDIQFGSHGWRTSSTGGAWAELSFETVQSATSYKLYVSGGSDSRTLTVNPPGSGTGQKYRLSDLLSGVSYTYRLSAVNGTGEGSQSAVVTFSTPARSDSTAPTSVSMAINDGAATTGGSRVRVRGTATDLGSGVAGYQISNDNNTWSTTYPLYDFSSINLITYRGGNAFFTDLAGWQTDTSVWAKVNSDPTAEQGGKAVAIRWDGTTAGTRVGLKLADTLPVTGGKEYTLAVRYKVTGLVTGSAGIFGNWTGGGGGAVDFALPAGPGDYQTLVLKMTAPGGATARNLVVGFSGANAGATLTVDWITLNEGPVPIVPANSLTNPVTNAVDWTIPNTSFGTKTIYTSYVDVAGNMTSSISATIQFMLTDTTAPRVTALPNGGAGTTDNPTVILTLTATDDSSGPNMLKMRFSTDGLIWSPWESFQPTKTWNICGNLTPALCEGQRQIWVEVQDPAQNTGGAITSIFFRQSVTPVADRLLIWATSGSTGEYDTGSGTITVQFLRLTEVGLQLDLTKFPGVKTIRYGFDPNRYGQWESIQATKTLMLPNIQGVQTLYVQTDTGQQLQLKFLLDYTAPEISVSWAGGATMTRPGGNATLVIDTLDNLARNEDLMVSVNGAPFVPWAPTLDVTLAGTGLQTVSVRVKDPAGNVKQTSLSIFAVAQ